MITARNGATGIVAENDQSAAQIAEESPLDQEDRGNAEEHVVQHSLHRDRNQIATIIERLDRHSRRQAPIGIEPPYGLAHARHHLHGALELLHQHDTEDDVRRLVAPRNAQPRRESNLHFGDVREQDGYATLLRQHDVADVLEASYVAEAADVDGLLTDVERPAAHVGVAGRDGGHDLRQGQPWAISG